MTENNDNNNNNNNNNAGAQDDIDNKLVSSAGTTLYAKVRVSERKQKPKPAKQNKTKQTRAQDK